MSLGGSKAAIEMEWGSHGFLGVAVGGDGGRGESATIPQVSSRSWRVACEGLSVSFSAKRVSEVAVILRRMNSEIWGAKHRQVEPPLSSSQWSTISSSCCWTAKPI